MERVFIGMSGGVDSSVAAALLKERGYDTVGVTLRLKPGDGADGDIEDAKNVAKALKMEHCVLDLRGEFKEKVMDYFAAEYLRGYVCNLLEENEEQLEVSGNTVSLRFKPFEIKTVKVTF